MGNALALESDLPGPALLRALNGLSPEVFFTRATSIPPSFRVRAATRRVYRYFEFAPPARAGRWQEAARCFSGEVDVRSLGRGLPTGSPQWRTVDAVDVVSGPGGLVIEVRARSFVWGMVRKIVGALREVDAGRLSAARLRRALAGTERLTLPMAEAEPLVLWDVEFPIEWPFTWTGPNRHQARGWEEARAQAVARQRLVDAVAPS